MSSTYPLTPETIQELDQRLKDAGERIDHLERILNDAVEMVNVPGTTFGTLPEAINTKLMERDRIHEKTIRERDTANGRVENLESLLEEARGELRKIGSLEDILRELGVYADPAFTLAGVVDETIVDLRRQLATARETLRENEQKAAETAQTHVWVTIQEWGGLHDENRRLKARLETSERESFQKALLQRHPEICWDSDYAQGAWTAWKLARNLPE